MDSSARNTKTSTRRHSIIGQALAATLCLSAYSACDQGPEDLDPLEDLDRGDGDDCPISDVPVAFHRGTWNPSSGDYELGDSDVILLENPPADTDERRWASLHNGTDAFVFFMNDGGNAVHEFRYEEADDDRPGLGGLPGLGGSALPSFTYTKTIPLSGFGVDVDKSSFAMLNDGDTTRLYFLNGSKNQLIQGAYNPSSQRIEFGHNSIPKVSITGTPGDADWSGWGMMYAQGKYRLYSFGAHDEEIHQYVWNNGTYHHGAAPKTFDVTKHHPDTIKDDFGMLHDGSKYTILHQMKVHEHPGFGDGFPGCPPGEPFCFE